jgi:ABC-2 type transport system ATP-binding protein
VQRAGERVAIVREGRLVTVQRVAALREARARRIRLVFGDGLGRRELGGVERWALRWEGDTVELLVPPGEVPGTLRELLERNVVDVAVEEAGLEEASLDLYRGADRQEPPGDRP